MDFCVFDTEGRGYIDENKYCLVQIGVIKIKSGVVDSVWNTNLNPQAPVSHMAYECHGLGLSMLENAPLFTDVADSFLEFTEGLPLVAFNVKSDMRMLNHDLVLARHDEIPYTRFLCAEKIASKLYEKNLSADRLALTLNVPGRTGSHSASEDARILWKCLEVMMQNESFSWENARIHKGPTGQRLLWTVYRENDLFLARNNQNDTILSMSVDYPPDYNVECNGCFFRISKKDDVNRKPYNPCGPALIKATEEGFKIVM